MRVLKRMASSEKSWLHITAPACAAGTVASVLTYTLLIHTSSVAAAGTGLLVDSAGAAVSAGTRFLFGDVPATTVRILGRIWSTTSETAIRAGGSYTALAAAAAVGGTTAVTVSVGTRLVEATIEYGGALTKTAAEKIGEAYLRFKASGHPPERLVENYECTESDYGDWICMDCSGSETHGQE